MRAKVVVVVVVEVVVVVAAAAAAAAKKNKVGTRADHALAKEHGEKSNRSVS